MRTEPSESAERPVSEVSQRARSAATERLAGLQRDEALRTVASVRDELTRVLEEHRANELHLAEAVRDAQGRLLQAQDTIAHMERSVFWRLRTWVARLTGR